MVHVAICVQLRFMLFLHTSDAISFFQHIVWHMILTLIANGDKEWNCGPFYNHGLSSILVSFSKYKFSLVFRPHQTNSFLT